MSRLKNKNQLMNNIDAHIEAILFCESGSVEKSVLMNILTIDESVLTEAITRLHERYTNRSIALVENKDSLAFVLTNESSTLITKEREEGFQKELSKSAIETLSIILYHPESSKTDIDYIRGVNSSMILRSLIMRGLIEKTPHKTDARKNVYIPTIDLLRYLGVTNVEDLPEYGALEKELEHVTIESTNE